MGRLIPKQTFTFTDHRFDDLATTGNNVLAIELARNTITEFVYRVDQIGSRFVLGHRYRCSHLLTKTLAVAVATDHGASRLTDFTKQPP